MKRGVQTGMGITKANNPTRKLIVDLFLSMHAEFTWQS